VYYIQKKVRSSNFSLLILVLILPHFWCETTLVHERELGRKRGDEIKYKLIAKEIMNSHNIQINELHAHAMKKLPEIKKQDGDVHYTPEAYAYLAMKVAKQIEVALNQDK
jgi:hypothetical protein